MLYEHVCVSDDEVLRLFHGEVSQEERLAMYIKMVHCECCISKWRELCKDKIRKRAPVIEAFLEIGAGPRVSPEARGFIKGVLDGD